MMKKIILVILIVFVFVLGLTQFLESKNKADRADKANAIAAVALEKALAFQTSSEPENTDPVEVASLRGAYALDNLSLAPTKNKWIKDGEFELNFDHQPPLIPHKTRGMKINMTFNQCLGCHSDENYKEEEAHKMSSTHFFTREDVRLKELSPRRYFCLQCHVPQVDREALIGSDYSNADED
jgi:cytochrome c-type protein NapB